MLFNLGSTFRSLTRSSPITTALEQSRRQARRWLEQGGAVSARDGAGDDAARGAFIVPHDIDAAALAVVIGTKLGIKGHRDGLQQALDRVDDGQLVVPAEVVWRLGEGDYDRGQRFLERAVGDIRGRRALIRANRSPG